MIYLKKLKSILIIITFLIGITTMTYAKEESKLVKVGYTTNDDIIDDSNYLDRKGYGYDILKKIEEVSDLKFEFIEITGDVREMMTNGDIDLTGFAYDHPDIENDYIISENSYGADYIVLATKEEKFVAYDNPTELDGKTVAIFSEGVIGKDYLDKYCVENGIKVKYVEASYEEYLDLEADYYIMYTENKEDVGFKTVLNLLREPIYFVATANNEELMREIDKATDYIKLHEGQFFLELEYKYNTRPDIIHRDLTVEEKKILGERPLKVGYEVNNLPVSFTNDEGEASGIVIRLMDILAMKYQFEVEYIPVQTDPNTNEPILEEIDMLLTMKDNDYNAISKYTYTDIIYEKKIMAIVSNELIIEVEEYKGKEDERTIKIGMPSYLNTKYNYFYDSAFKIEVIYYDNLDASLEAYKNKEIEAVMFTESHTTYANAYLDSEDNYIYTTEEIYGYKFGINNNIASEYVPIFNVMFDKISKNEYYDITAAYTSKFYPKTSTVKFLMDRWYAILGGLVVSIMIVMLGFLRYKYRFELQKANEMIEISRKDYLTGGMSLNYFIEKGFELTRDVKKGEYECITFDMDKFRAINKYFGIEKGNIIIKAIAKGLDEAFEGTDVIYARRTAEMFVILRKIDESNDIESIYYRYILPRVKEQLPDKYNISFSFGSVVLEEGISNINEIRDHADYARKAGKKFYKNTFINYNKSLQKEYENTINITFRMKQAIKDKEFKVVFQPKIDFDSLKIESVEALARWYPKYGEVIYPDSFIRIFEDTGFITTLDMYMMEMVCDYINKNRKIVKLPVVSVNLSVLTIVKENLLEELLDILKVYDVLPQEICLEVTESALLNNEERLVAIVKSFKRAGFIVSLDDFGSGVSSLNRLSVLDVDELKLDKEFMNITNDITKNKIIIEKVLMLAKELKIKVVAEGLETYEQVIWLRSMGCDVAQGYYFSKPIDDEDLKALIKEDKEYILYKK